MSEDGDRVNYVAMSDKYQEPEQGPKAPPESWSHDLGEGGYPVARIKLRMEQGEGTTANFDTYAANHGGVSFNYRNRSGGSKPPTELFHTDPDRLVVDSAFAHPDMSRHVPHLLAIAQMDNPHVKLSAAEDLSGYSSRLSKNAVNRGLALPHPGNLDMSSDGEPIDANQDAYSRRTMVSDRVMDESTRIPEHAILNGKQFLRAALGRKPRTEQMKAPDTEQLTLPGI
jgi:hypothetical protein